MYEWIRTDNEFANAEFRDHLVADPVLAALIDLLVARGVVNQVELASAINERCQIYVNAREKVNREDYEG